MGVTGFARSYIYAALAVTLAVSGCSESEPGPEDDSCQLGTSSDCNACGDACGEPTPFCQPVADEAFECTSTCRRPTPTTCGGQCVSLDDNLLHCGDCDNACVSEQICASGQCLNLIVDDGVTRRWADGSYATDCDQYLDPPPGNLYDGAVGDGRYTIDPDGDGPLEPHDVYCDMSTDGGGWTLAFFSSRNLTGKSGLGTQLYSGNGLGSLDDGPDMYAIPNYGPSQFVTGIQLRVTWVCGANHQVTELPGAGPSLLDSGTATWNDDRADVVTADGSFHTSFSNLDWTGDACQGDGNINPNAIYGFAIGNGGGYGNYIGWYANESTAISADARDNVDGTVAGWFK